MGRGKPVHVGDRVFATKKAATEAIRLILYRYGIGQVVNADDSAFLLDLIQLHPEVEQKIGSGIAAFSVEQNDGSRGFWLTRVDGSRTDWSFLACLAPPTPEQESLAGLRSAVRDQIEAFRVSMLARSDLRCAVSNAPLNAENIHVDHDPPFQDLVLRFLAPRAMPLATVRVKPTTDGSTVTELADDALRVLWTEFHRTNAGLRAVTRQVNLGLLRRTGARSPG
jgi:hypothetical protein